jgi:hypothetical protein
MFPIIETKTNCTVEFNFENYKNETAVLEILRNKKELCNLSENDFPILKDFVVSGYSVKEQTYEEYTAFLKEAEQANFGRPNDCLEYEAVSHKGRWTGYVKTGYTYTKEYGCVVVPCFSPTVNIIWNDLSTTKKGSNYSYLLILLFVAIALVALLRKLKR